MMYPEEEAVSFGTESYLTAQRGCLLLSILGNQMLNPLAGNRTHHERDPLKYRHMDGQELSVLQL